MSGHACEIKIIVVYLLDDVSYIDSKMAGLIELGDQKGDTGTQLPTNTRINVKHKMWLYIPVLTVMWSSAESRVLYSGESSLQDVTLRFRHSETVWIRLLSPTLDEHPGEEVTRLDSALLFSNLVISSTMAG